MNLGGIASDWTGMPGMKLQDFIDILAKAMRKK